MVDISLVAPGRACGRSSSIHLAVSILSFSQEESGTPRVRTIEILRFPMDFHKKIKNITLKTDLDFLTRGVPRGRTTKNATISIGHSHKTDPRKGRDPAGQNIGPHG